jgi:hypothetical protein
MKLTMTQQSRNEQLPATAHLEIGNQLFHNGVPVQLLYRVRSSKSHETWRVRPLFVDGQDRNELFHASDIISFLHTMRASRWSCAA